MQRRKRRERRGQRGEVWGERSRERGRATCWEVGLQVALAVEGGGEGHVVQRSGHGVAPGVGSHALDAVLRLVRRQLLPQDLRRDVGLQQNTHIISVVVSYWRLLWLLMLLFTEGCDVGLQQNTQIIIIDVVIYWRLLWLLMLLFTEGYDVGLQQNTQIISVVVIYWRLLLLLILFTEGRVVGLQQNTIIIIVVIIYWRLFGRAATKHNYYYCCYLLKAVR